MDGLFIVAIVAPSVVFTVVQEDNAAIGAIAACRNIGCRANRRICITSSLGVKYGVCIHSGTNRQGHGGHGRCAHVSVMRSSGLGAIGGVVDGGTIKGADDVGLAVTIEGDGRGRHRHIAELRGGHFRDLAGAGHSHGHGLEGRVGRMPLDAEARALSEQGTIGGRRFGTVGGIADVVGLVEAGRHCVGDEGHRVAINKNLRHTRGRTLVGVGEGVRSNATGIVASHNYGLHFNTSTLIIQVNAEGTII